MMPTPPSFPNLPGQGWSVHKRPSFATRVAQHVSGREVRSAFFSTALYEFEVTFDALSSNAAFPGAGANSLQELMSLYVLCQGQHGTFLYTDPTDHAANGQTIAIGDGITTEFKFIRSLGGVIEPVSWVTGVSHIYVDGEDEASGWELREANTLAFSVPPASGAVITADFTYAYECRFLDDQADFENFMNGLWRVQSLKFRSVRS
jgi:uncharacterized protein (TIGR02217 family)